MLNHFLTRDLDHESYTHEKGEEPGEMSCGSRNGKSTYCWYHNLRKIQLRWSSNKTESDSF
jgi:hypothetical protein